MTRGESPDVRVEIGIAARAAVVWRALADRDARRAWWPALELDLRPGGSLLERWSDATGTQKITRGAVLDADPPHRVRCSWRDDDWPAATEVELELVPDGTGTHVRLAHRGWKRLGADRAALPAAHEAGWRRHLADLKAYAEAAPAQVAPPPDPHRDATWARCAAQRGATLEYPFGDEAAVFKAAGRMFAVISVPGVPARVTLKCDPPLGAALVEEHAAVAPGYHTDKRHWITVTLDGSVDQDLLDDLVDASYDLVVAKLPKRVRATLDG